MRIAALAAAVPLLLAARPAWPCGGGSGGSDSGGGGSSSSGGGGGDSGSTSSSAPPCIDTSEVVGRASCRRFGAWDSGHEPPTVITLGSSLHFFGLKGMRFDGTADHDTSYKYAVLGEQAAAQAVAATFDLRVAIGLGRYLYLGAETGVGRWYVDRTRLTVDGELVLQPAGAAYVEMGAVAGVRLPLGDLEIFAEGMGGARIVTLETTSFRGDCEDRSTASDISPLVETRVGAATWLSPWMSLGAMVGTSPLRRGDMSAGVFLEGHLRAFDGGR